MKNFDLPPYELDKSVVALVSICDLLGFERPQNLKPIDMGKYVNLVNAIADKLGIPTSVNKSLVTFCITVQTILDECVSSVRISLDEFEKVYNEKLLELK